MRLNRMIRNGILLLTVSAAAAAALSGCGSAASIDLDSIRSANSTSEILKLHSSILEDFSYYENLDENVTFQTSYCYSEDFEGKAVYQAEGHDALEPESDDNFSYCIVGNIEYFSDHEQDMILYPLTSAYIDEFRSSSFTIRTDDSEKLKSVKKSGYNYVVTTLSDASERYSEETLSSLNSLSGDIIEEVKTVYTVDKKTLLLSRMKMYYVGQSGKEYLFSEETVIYDGTEPDVEFALPYVNPAETRTVTVVEKTDAGDTSNVYVLPADCAPDFRCFRQLYNYELYNDAAGLDPFTSETADASGKYTNITLYAIPSASGTSSAAIAETNGN